MGNNDVVINSFTQSTGTRYKITESDSHNSIPTNRIKSPKNGKPLEHCFSFVDYTILFSRIWQMEILLRAWDTGIEYSSRLVSRITMKVFNAIWLYLKDTVILDVSPENFKTFANNFALNRILITVLVQLMVRMCLSKPRPSLEVIISIYKSRFSIVRLALGGADIRFLAIDVWC